MFLCTFDLMILITSDIHNRSFGNAAVEAYQIYNISNYLSIAEGIWVYVNGFTITPQDIMNGIPEQNLTLTPLCRGECFFHL